MAYAQVKQSLHSWKMAAFIVAFFSPFFAYSQTVIEAAQSGALITKSPKLVSVNGYCRGQNLNACAGSPYSMQDSVEDVVEEYKEDNPTDPAAAWSTYTETLSGLSCGVYDCDTIYGTIHLKMVWAATGNSLTTESFTINSFTYNAPSCAPDSDPSFTYPIDYDGDSQPDACANPADVNHYLETIKDLQKDDDYCKTLVLDTGNNTSSNTCYISDNGAHCSTEKVTTADGFTFYQGTANEPLGCGSSSDTPHDSAGAGDEKDGCIYTAANANEGSSNFCKASLSKHCKVTQGVEVCDAGCFKNGDSVYCDVKRHPDVGEGESDYFNDKGTCSVISASSSKGNCEEMGGTWDDTSDYSPTSCPVGSGTCSTGATICGACMDEGGVWTPDSNAQTDVDAIKDVAQRIKSSNEKLTAIEATTRKTGEALVSTVKTGNGKIVAAIENLTKVTKDKATGAAAAKEEKETFTTTTGDVDKTAFNSLFDAASKLALESEIAQLKTDITTFINSAKAEASTLMSITVPSSTGYQARNLTLSQGTFDLSLTRFSDFCVLLAGPIMLVCSILAAFILLGSKD